MSEERKKKYTLKDLRYYSGMTQEETAKELGVSVPTYRRWERDNSRITLADLNQILHHFETPASEFLFPWSTN